ncbi:unnamed protein product, partial [Darwinula stevensoni]
LFIFAGDLCNIEQDQELHCKFTYEDLGIVEVSGGVKPPSGMLGPANLTLTINVVSHQLKWEHDFPVCHGKNVIRIPGVTVYEFPVVMRMEFEPDISQPHIDNTKAILASGYLEGENGERKHLFLRSSFLPKWDQLNLEKIPLCINESIPDLQSRLVNIESQLPDLWSHLANISSHLPDLQSRLTNVEPQLPDLQSRLANVESQLPDLQSHLANVESQLPDLQSHLANVESQLPDLQSRLANVESQLPDLQSHLANVESQLPDLQSHLANVESQLPDLQSRLANLESQLPDLQSHLANVESQLPDLQSRLANIESQLISLKSDMTTNHILAVIAITVMVALELFHFTGIVSSWFKKTAQNQVRKHLNPFSPIP